MLMKLTIYESFSHAYSEMAAIEHDDPMFLTLQSTILLQILLSMPHCNGSCMKKVRIKRYKKYGGDDI